MFLFDNIFCYVCIFKIVCFIENRGFKVGFKSKMDFLSEIFFSSQCRNRFLKYGYDSRVLCYVLEGGRKAPPCSFHTVLQDAAYTVNEKMFVLRMSQKKRHSSFENQYFEKNRPKK